MSQQVLDEDALAVGVVSVSGRQGPAEKPEFGPPTVPRRADGVGRDVGEWPEQRGSDDVQSVGPPTEQPESDGTDERESIRIDRVFEYTFEIQ